MDKLMGEEVDCRKFSNCPTKHWIKFSSWCAIGSMMRENETGTENVVD